MKKGLLVTAAMAAALVLASCSSDTEAGPSSSPDTVAVSSDASVPSADPTASESAAGTVEGTQESMSTESVTPADLDESTVAWMTSFCVGFAELGAAFSELASTDPADTAAYAAVQSSVGATMTDLGDSLAALPAPTLTDGENLASTFAGMFSEEGVKLTDSGAALAAADDSDGAASTTAAAVTAGVDEAIGSRLSTLTDLSPEEAAGIGLIPECATMAPASAESPPAPVTS